MNRDDFLSSFLLPVDQIPSYGVSIEQYNELVVYTQKAVARVNELEGQVAAHRSTNDNSSNQQRKEKIELTNKLVAATNTIHSLNAEVSRSRSLDVIVNQYKGRIVSMEAEQEDQKAKKGKKGGKATVNVPQEAEASAPPPAEDNMDDLWSDSDSPVITPVVKKATVLPPPPPPMVPSKVVQPSSGSNVDSAKTVTVVKEVLPAHIKAAMQESMSTIGRLVNEVKTVKHDLEEKDRKVIGLEKVVQRQRETIGELEDVKMRAKVALRAVRAVSYKQICKQQVKQGLLDHAMVAHVANSTIVKTLNNLDLEEEGEEEEEAGEEDKEQGQRESMQNRIVKNTKIITNVVKSSSSKGRDTEVAMDIVNATPNEVVTSIPKRKRVIIDDDDDDDEEEEKQEKSSSTVTSISTEPTFLGNVSLSVDKKRKLREQKKDESLLEETQRELEAADALSSVSKHYTALLSILSNLRSTQPNQGTVDSYQTKISQHYRSDSTIHGSILLDGLQKAKISQHYSQLLSNANNNNNNNNNTVTYNTLFTQFTTQIQDISNILSLLCSQDALVEVILKEYDLFLQSIDDTHNVNYLMTVLLFLGMFYLSGKRHTQTSSLLRRFVTTVPKLHITYYLCIVECFPGLWAAPLYTTDVVTPHTVLTNLKQVMHEKTPIKHIDDLSIEAISQLAFLNNVAQFLATASKIPHTRCVCATEECGFCMKEIATRLLNQHFANWAHQSIFGAERVAGNIRIKLLFFILYKCFQEQILSVEMQQIVKLLLLNAPWQWTCITIEKVLLPLFTTTSSIFHKSVLLYIITILTPHILPHITVEGPASNTLHIIRVLCTTLLLDPQTDMDLIKHADVLLTKANYRKQMSAVHANAT